MSVSSFATPAIPQAPDNCPLLIGTHEDFKRVREFLAQIGFSDVALPKALEIPDISDLVRVDWDKTPTDKLSAELRLFLDVFVRLDVVTEAKLAATWGVDTLDAMRALGLLRPSTMQPGHLRSTVWLSPVAGFIAASDLSRDPEDATYQQPDDAVFPAIESLTNEFLHFLPDVRGGEALDLCGGSGIGALHLARTARFAATADITQRSAFYAAFNGMLNDMPIASYCGDLYEPVAGRQFDLISAHPPYVPEIGPRMIYRDGGEAGETITRGIIEGLPRHLRPGGSCVIVAYCRDTNAQPFELRVRDWLGDAGAEFDILFAVDRNQTIEHVTQGQRSRLKGDDIDEQLSRFAQRLRDLDTRRFAHGVLMLHRKSQPTTSVPLRLQIHKRTSAAEFNRIFAWRDRRQQRDFQTWLPAQRPRLAPHLELRSRQVVKDGQLVDADLAFHVEANIESSLRLERWIVSVLSRFNGQQSVRELFDASHKARAFPDGFPFEAFTELVDVMLERGFLELAQPA